MPITQEITPLPNEPSAENLAVPLPDEPHPESGEAPRPRRRRWGRWEAERVNETNTRLGRSETTHDILEIAQDGYAESQSTLPQPPNGSTTYYYTNTNDTIRSINQDEFYRNFNTAPAAIQGHSSVLPPIERTPWALTYGEKAVWLSFNPTGRQDVSEIKRMYANIIDTLHLLRIQAQGEAARHFSVAITETETAQMRAIKAITWVN